MHRNRIPSLAVIAAGGLFIAACGGDTEPLSKPEFIKQADAICQTANDEVEPVFETVFADFDDSFDPDDPTTQGLIFARWAEAMDEIEPVFDQQLDDIGALEPPADDKEVIETLLADQDDALTEFVRIIDAAAAGDEEARAALDTEEDPFTDVNQRAREYGLTVCGREDG